MGQQVKEHTPSAVRNAFGKVSVSHRALDVEVLYIDGLVSRYIKVSRFMQKVLSLVADLLMSLGNKHARLV